VHDAVKSRAKPSALFFATAVLLGASQLLAQKRDPPVLFGGPAAGKKAPVELDPRLPTGSEVSSPAQRPSPSEVPGCAFRAPVCVHRGAGVSEAKAALTLVALERAWLDLSVGLALPPPVDVVDLYLDARHAELVVGHDPPELGRFDRARGFCLLGNEPPAELQRSVTLCIGESIALGVDPAETPHLRRAYATHLWHLVGNPTNRDYAALDDIQANPQLAVATRERNFSSEGAAIWFDYLENSRGAGAPGTLATSLFASSSGKTDPRSLLWDNAPDMFDVLRHTLATPRAYADMMIDFAVTRAFLGDRDDGAHFVQSEWLGTFGRVRFDWSIPLSSLPRRVAPLKPIEPNGAMYLWLDLDRVPDKTELGFRGEWEPPVSFQWTLVLVDAKGAELRRLNAPFVERGTQAELNVVDLSGARGIVVVGTNLGGVDLSHPFDPDYAPFEAHGCTVYLAKL
jgi:hypothetical protein